MPSGQKASKHACMQAHQIKLTDLHLCYIRAQYDGSQVLAELLQNADDARATQTCFLLDQVRSVSPLIFLVHFFICIVTENAQNGLFGESSHGTTPSIPTLTATHCISRSIFHNLLMHGLFHCFVSGVHRALHCVHTTMLRSRMKILLAFKTLEQERNLQILLPQVL